MAKELFPWQETARVPLEENTATPTNIASLKIIESFKKFMPLYLLLALIVVVMIFRPVKKEASTAAYNSITLDVLVVMLPTPKGEEIVPETLKSIPVRESSLTKTQALQVIRLEDVMNLRGKLIAKKNLPPNKPIFWNDVEFKIFKSTKASLKIHYPKESP